MTIAAWYLRWPAVAALVAAVLGSSVAAAAEPEAAADLLLNREAWSALSLPSPGPPTVIGRHTNGCIAGAVPLPLVGLGYQVIRAARNRYWGHPQTIATIQDIAAQFANERVGLLLVADIGQPRGGPITGHGSHAIGLDADIWFRITPTLLSPAALAEPAPYSVVREGSFEIDASRWSPVYIRLLQIAATEPNVERIFVNPVIKQTLCDRVTGDRSWLGKVRPWYLHDEHFHIRLGCPVDSPDCRPQDAVPAGEGCGESLAWWFTDEPYAPPSRSTEPPPPPPPLPEACAPVLTAPDVQPAVAQ